MHFEELYVLWLGLKGKTLSVCGICQRSIVVDKECAVGVCNCNECWKKMFISKTRKGIDLAEKELSLKEDIPFNSSEL